MKGFIFTTDMLIALSMIFVLFLSFFLFKFEASTEERTFESLSYVSEDIMDVLSTLKVEEVENQTIVNELIVNGSIKTSDMNKTIIDLITSYWYGNKTSIAFEITESILSNITQYYCVGITIDNEEIYYSCPSLPDDRSVSVSSRIETGYEMGKPTFGYIARAYLTSLSSKVNFDYIYFGGYEGEGNLTKTITLPESLDAQEIIMEMNVGSNFDLYINGNYSGTYSPTAINMSANRWYVCNQTSPNYCSDLEAGKNRFQINFSSWDDSYVGGGYIKVTYNTSEFSSNKTERYQFPGVNGLVNLYSSFYIPGQLNSMNLYLDYNTDYSLFLNIGNVTVHNDSEGGKKTIILDNANLSAALDYNYLSNKTIPLRIGTKTLEKILIGNGDVVLVTDLSGSMQWCSNEPYGSDPHSDYRWTRWDSNQLGSWKWVSISSCDDDAQRNYEIAKDANLMFTRTVLNTSGNQIGLVDYSGSQWVYNYTAGGWFRMYEDNIVGTVSLTNDTISLENHINDTNTWWGTCICCGINEAKDMVETQSIGDKNKAIVIMSDGEANIECSEQGNNDAKQDTIQAGQEACALGIDVYTVGFGEGVDEDTLNQTACDSSMYYSSQNVSQLIEIYEEIAEHIIEGSYTTQTINVTGNHSINNTLSPDSYIELNYTENVDPFSYGEISIRKETDRLDNLTGYFSNQSYTEAGFYIPDEITATKIELTSYSSEYWTDRLYVDNSTWERVYWLGDYGDDYSILGDPFIVNIPSNLIYSGQTNYIRTGTGVEPENATGASDFDRIIYDARLSGSVGYGGVFNSSEEAMDDATSRLVTEVQNYVDIDEDDIEVQTESIVNMRWLWGPSLVKVSVWNNN